MPIWARSQRHGPQHRQSCGWRRGRGYGTRILQEAAAEARRRGCRAGVLYTITFQAPEFYARHGWEEFGRVECDPPGTARVFFRKTFTPADDPDGS